MIRGAFAAALTPLREGGTALDEPAFEPYLAFLAGGRRGRDPRAGDDGEGILLAPASAGGPPSSSSRPPGRLAVAVHCGAQTTAETAALAAHAAESGADAVAVIAPPYFRSTRRAQTHFAAAAAACAPLPFYLYEFAARSGYPIPLAVVERLRERAPNLRGLKVSDKPWEKLEPYLLEGLDVFVGAESLVARGLARGAAGAVSALASGFPEIVAELVREPTEERSAGGRPAAGSGRPLPLPGGAEGVAARRGVPIRPDVRAPLRRLTAASSSGSRCRDPGRGRRRDRRQHRLPARAAGSVGGRALRPRAVGGGSTARAMGGVRQQFSTAAEVLLARESIAFFAELGPPFFDQVGYLFLATSERASPSSRGAASSRPGSASRSSRSTPRSSPGSRPETCSGRLLRPGRGRRPGRGHARARPPLAGARSRGREQTAAEALLDAADTLVIACGAWSAALGERVGLELPVRPLCRQLLATTPLPGLPAGAADGGRERERLPLPPPRRAARARDGRRDAALRASSSRRRLGLRRPARRGSRAASRPPPAPAVEEAWAGLYDMTPDAHPIIGRVADGVYAACGFSGHGFMQSPAAGQAIAEEILEGQLELDLALPARALLGRAPSSPRRSSSE